MFLLPYFPLLHFRLPHFQRPRELFDRGNFSTQYFITYSVATQLKCGGIFDNHCTTILLTNLLIKIERSYNFTELLP